MEQQDLNKRLLLALVLSFFVFVGYGYFFPAPKPVEQIQKDVVTTQQTPIVTNTTAPTPTLAEGKVKNTAPVQTKGTVLATLKSTHFIMTIDELGRIAQFELLEDKYKDENGNTVKMIGEGEVKPLEVRFADVKLNDEAFKTPYVNTGSSMIDVSSTAQTITLTQTLSNNVIVTKNIMLKPTGEYEVSVSTSLPSQFFVTPGHRPIADTSMYMLVRGALVKGADDIITTIEDGDAEGYEKFSNAKIASSFDRYVTSLFFDFEKGLNVSILKQANDDPLIFVQGDNALKLNGYIGTKDHEGVKSINPELRDAIELGRFSFLSKPFYMVLLW